MSTQALPPNPSLVAIVLIAKTRRGIKRIFHYPPNPGKERPHARLDYEHSSEEESTSASEHGSYSSLEDDDNNNSNRHPASIDIEDLSSVSPEKSSAGKWPPPTRAKTSGLLGLPEGIDSFLCPPEDHHKKRFEMSIGELVFLGWPVYAKDGEWKRKRKSRGPREHSKQPSRKMSTISEQELASMSRRSSVQIDEHLGETSGNESANEDAEPTAEEEATQQMANLATLQEEEYADGRPPKTNPDLAMFHVVFVMHPPPLEYQLRVDDMYKHVVKKFSRALKWEQSRASYVQKECEKLKAMKAKHVSLAQHAIRNSSLASAIATLYHHISTSRIAHITLTPRLQFSLQIPIPTSISTLPDLIAPSLPGLWLTTSTSIPSNDELHNTRSKLASHFALLLLTDLPSILSDIESTSSPISAPLKAYLHATTPTKSFLQISQSSGISLADIHFLASHLIYWRRARAVPPLHQRDIYIVSPNADMRKLRSASAQYARLFPVQLPSLPKMLAMLSSGSPRPYSALVPSKVHKPVYYEVLAWLLRGGWVTQLRTFAWVRVPTSIQALAAKEMAARKDSGVEDDDDEEEEVEQEDSGLEDGSEEDDERDAGHAGRPGQRDLKPGALSPKSGSDLASPASASSARTAIPLGMMSSAGSLPPKAADAEQHDATAYRPKLVLQPTKATGLESRYLAVIAREMEKSEGEEARKAWELCVKYFNGEHALEKIAVREGWKRKRVEALRQSWMRMGVLSEVRYW